MKTTLLIFVSAAGLALCAADGVTRDGFTVDERALADSKARLVFSADGKSAVLNTARVPAAERAALAKRAFRLMALGADTKKGDFPALVKKGAGTLTLANVHNQNRFGDGVEVFGGSVVLDQNSPHQALMPYSLGGADLTMHDGTTLDMTACGTDELRFSTLDVAAGAQIVGVAGNVIAARGGTALPAGFAFEGTLNMAADSTLTVNVPDPEAYAKKSLLTGLSANSLANAASIAVVFGAKPDRWYYVVCPAEDLTEEQVAALSQKLNVSGPGVKPEKWSFERANNELRLYGPYPGFQFIVR